MNFDEARYLYDDKCRMFTEKTVVWIFVRIVTGACNVVTIEVASYVNDGNDQIAGLISSIIKMDMELFYLLERRLAFRDT